MLVLSWIGGYIRSRRRVGALAQLTVPMIDALHNAAGGLDIEAAAGADGTASGMDTGLLASGHVGTHPVAGLKTVNLLSANQASWALF